MNFICALIIFSSLSGKIQGIVTDEDTDLPLPSVNVIIQKTQLGTATGEDGYFYFLNVQSGVYDIEISYIGYQTKIIKNVLVEVDRAVRLNITLKQTPIEMSPVTVTDERPAVTKDMVGTTYIIRKDEITHVPIDYTTHLISLQPAVATMDTALHVRGGRATEVQYMIDNVSIIDPQTGDPGIIFSKGIIDEIVFMPGAFDAEYGRAMSGVINIITAYPQNNLQTTVYGKTETIMPFYYDFGYKNYQASAHLPVSQKYKGFLSFDVMHTDDWDPRLYKYPHKERDDYALYGKWLVAPSGKLHMSLSGALSRTQFDRYYERFRYNLDHYRSDLRKGNFQALNIDYLPDSKKLFHLTLSRLYTNRETGVREPGVYGVFDDFDFRDYNILEYPHGGYMNPFGVYVYTMRTEGDYPEYRDKHSCMYKAHVKTVLQVHKYHEIKTGCEYVYNDLENFTYFLSSDTTDPFIDEWHYKPKELGLYVQDNIDYEGLYAKVGCRYDYFSSDIPGVEPKTIISPRAGFSFMVTEKFLFRANIGKYTQPPLYDHMYSYYNLLPFPSYMLYLFNYIKGIVGNPDLEPEQTMSYEIGLQGEIRKNLSLTVNTFYKDVTGLVGSRWVPVVQSDRGYTSYLNVEYANVKGIEAILDFSNPIIQGKISYTLSWARGTSSYADEVFDRYYYQNPEPTDHPMTQEYNLDFDQRHRIFIQGAVNLPLQTKLYLFGYIGHGFPYTPPGSEGKYEERNIFRFPFRNQIDCVLSKLFKIGRLSLNLNFEIINILDERTLIAFHGPIVPIDEILPEDFLGGMSIASGYYNPGADLNHDGYISAYEEYTSYRDFMIASDDWPQAYSSPRRARIGFELKF